MTKEETLIMYAPLTYLLIPSASAREMVGEGERMCDCIFDRVKLYLMCNPEKVNLLYKQLSEVLPAVSKELEFKRAYFEEVDGSRRAFMVVCHRGEKFEAEINRERG